MNISMSMSIPTIIMRKPATERVMFTIIMRMEAAAATIMRCAIITVWINL